MDIILEAPHKAERKILSEPATPLLCTCLKESKAGHDNISACGFTLPVTGTKSQNQSRCQSMVEWIENVVHRKKPPFFISFGDLEAQDLRK